MKYIILILGSILLVCGSMPSIAAAQTVETDFNTVTAIRDLELNGTIYDVEFLLATPADVYGNNPPTFDFGTAEEAQAAVDGVVDVLNAQGNAFKVGPSDANGSTSFQIAFDELLEESTQVAETWGGATSDASATGVWATGSESMEFPFLESGSFADFIDVGSTGSGNQPPVADAGGKYEGEANTVLTFDGSRSSDPDGTIVTHTWDFGDETSFGGETVQHTYASGGIYFVTLTVVDDEGA